MGKEKRAHLYPVMGTGACPLPILTSALSTLKVKVNPVGFTLTFNWDTALAF